MTDMPTKSYLTSGTTTEAQFQSAIGDFYDVVSELGFIGPAQSNEIVAGVISPTKSDIIVDTELLSSADSLDLILPTTIGEKVIFIRCTSSSRLVTLKHNSAGTGKLFLSGLVDVVLKDPRYVVALKWSVADGRWNEMWRNFGLFIAAGDEGLVRTQLGLGTAATRNTGILTGQIPLKDNLGTAAFVNTGTSSGQVPLSNQLGSLAFKSLITNSELDGTGVIPGSYGAVQVNAQGRVTGGASSSGPVRRVINLGDNMTWTKPSGLSYIEVAVVGAGGGGATFPNAGNGTQGGSTTFGGLCTATGGAGALSGAGPVIAAGGVGTVGQYLLQGGNGNARTPSGAGGYFAGGNGASVPFFITGGAGGVNGGAASTPGGGGGSGGSQGDRGNGAGGGGGAWARLLASDLPSTITMVVGTGGPGPAGNGGNGQIVIWEYY